MKPILFSIYNFSFSSYFIIVFLAAFSSALLFLYLSKKYNYNLILAVDILIIIMFTWFIGSRAMHIIFEMPFHYINKPIEILYFHKGGFVVYGAFIVSAFFIYLYLKHKKQSYFKFIDIFSPALFLGMSIGRLGCLMQGCCYGKESSISWGIIISSLNNSLRHPTQIYMSLYNFIIFLISLYLLKKKNIFIGFTGLVSIILYTIFRFIVEYYRADYRGNFIFLSISQYISIIIFTISLSLLFIKLKKQ